MRRRHGELGHHGVRLLTNPSDTISWLTIPAVVELLAGQYALEAQYTATKFVDVLVRVGAGRRRRCCCDYVHVLHYRLAAGDASRRLFSRQPW